MSDTPLSGASLGLDRSTDDQPAIGAFETRETDRYEDGGLLGRGGMGEVRAAHEYDVRGHCGNARCFEICERLEIGACLVRR